MITLTIVILNSHYLRTVGRLVTTPFLTVDWQIARPAFCHTYNSLMVICILAC